MSIIFGNYLSIYIWECPELWWKALDDCISRIDSNWEAQETDMAQMEGAVYDMILFNKIPQPQRTCRYRNMQSLLWCSKRRIWISVEVQYDLDHVEDEFSLWQHPVMSHERETPKSRAFLENHTIKIPMGITSFFYYDFGFVYILIVTTISSPSPKKIMISLNLGFYRMKLTASPRQNVMTEPPLTLYKVYSTVLHS